MKRLIFLILVTLLPMLASAYDAEIGGICYNFSDDEATVTRDNNGNSYSGALVIPASVLYGSVNNN